MSDESFVVTVNNRRRVRVSYKKDGIHHIFSSPDVHNCSAFATDKNRAYQEFYKRLKELLK